MTISASYAFLSAQEWDNRIQAADVLTSPCVLCPRNCRVDRFKGQKGFCKAGSGLTISSIFPHHGEEPPISGEHGSGTVFFSHCSLCCCFCQNYQISQEGEGQVFTVEQLAQSMLNLQKQQVHNINFVTGTHYLPWILRAIRIAKQEGLFIPLVWNSSGYETVEAVSLLKGIVDVFLPDMKYGSNEPALKYCAAPDYVEYNRAVIKKMFKMVGPLTTDKNGVAKRGICIRHLVLPEKASHTDAILSFLESAFDTSDITLSLMAQFSPMYKASQFTELSRRITLAEYAEVQKKCEAIGLNLFCQELPSLDDSFCIDFTTRKTEPLTGL
jgi:putative pyruvate formate lyase activating enzyme